MTDSEMDGGVTRDDLVQRIELMERMIAEGRRSTCRNGWIFVIWGLACLAAIGWLYFQPHSAFAGMWAWPICLTVGVVIMFLGKLLRERGPGSGKNVKSQTLTAVWNMTCLAMMLYVASVIVRHLSWQLSYAAAILIFLGLAHAISAVILRWSVQGVVAGLLWARGAAVLFVPTQKSVMLIFLLEMCIGLLFFGLYMMWLERRGGSGWGKQNA